MRGSLPHVAHELRLAVLDLRLAHGQDVVKERSRQLAMLRESALWELDPSWAHRCLGYQGPVRAALTRLLELDSGRTDVAPTLTKTLAALEEAVQECQYRPRER